MEGDADVRYVAKKFIITCGDQMYPIVNLPLCIGGTVFGSIGDSDIRLTGRVGDRSKAYPVKMWKVEYFPGYQPRLMVKTTDGIWLRLMKPQECYERAASDAFILLFFLDFVKRFSSASVTDVEQYLKSECRTYGRAPFIPKLSKHVRLLRNFLEKDESLKQSSVFRKLFPQIFTDRKDSGSLPSSKDTLKSILGIYTIEELDDRRFELIWEGEKGEEVHPRTSKKSSRGGGDRSPVQEKVERSRSSIEGRDLETKALHSAAEKEDLFDPPICIICDDGGDVLMCDGPCSRHFHAIPGSGADSFCSTLGLTKKETKASQWFCSNCEFNQHQCFACGQLGLTDASDEQPEVYMCAMPSCRRYYHARCLARLVNLSNWRETENAVRTGAERIICTRHKCDTCGSSESTPGALVQCRRCPKAWHRECFENYRVSGESDTSTIWTHEQYEFVYCKKHEIDHKTNTPRRDHLRFPEKETAGGNLRKLQ